VPLSAVRAYGSAAHSLLGAGALAGAVGVAGWLTTRKSAHEKPALTAMVSAGLAASALHLLLDLCSNTGVELYWPFRTARVAWNLAGGFDAILLAVLALCALLPGLLSLVTEEIGEKKDAQPGRGWPVAALVLLALYLGGRGFLHSRAEELLGAARYQEASARNWAAYPSGVLPFTWRGVVETDSFLAEVEVPVGGRTAFDPRRAVARFKPESSPALAAAAASPLARAYTALAKFPSASIETTPEGTRAELRELGDSPLHSASGTWLGIIELDAQLRVVRQELYFLSAGNP
jgi:hypothetical protein